MKSIKITSMEAHHFEAVVRLALVDQVANAVPPGGNERDVTTIISRPLWRVWCRAMGHPEDSEPTEWGISPNHIHVYGSYTIVVENPKMIAVSGVTSTAKLINPFTHL